MSTIEEIVAEHRSDEHRLCYAQTLGPITAVHQFSNRTETKVLRCTLPLGHEEDHRDAACCYSRHVFSLSMATPPQPEHRNLERCVKCRQDWPCDVALIGDVLAEMKARSL